MLRKEILRAKRKVRIRKKVKGSETMPRLSVYRSGEHIYAQVINDDAQKTVVAMSSVDPSVRSKLSGKSGIEIAKLVGTEIAIRALAAGVKKVVFDRGGYRYHGRVKVLADAARSGGLEF